MRIRLDRTLCDGFGLCAKHAPVHFPLDDWGYASLAGDGVIADPDHDAVTRALLDCPVHAIIAMPEPATPGHSATPRQSALPESTAPQHNSEDQLMSGAKLLVFSNAVADRDAEFNDWYDTTHLADVTAVPGVAGGARYEIAATDIPGQPAPAHRYLAVYDLDGEPEAVLAEFFQHARAGKIPLSETLDLTSVAMTVWRPR